MHSTRIAAFALLSAALLHAAPAEAQERWSWNRQVGAGQMIEIKGVNGGITVTAGSGSEVRVTAVKTARRSNVGEVALQVVEHDGGVTICAVYPSTRAGQPNECRRGEGGRMNVQNNDVQVAFTVEVPAGVRFVGRTVNGAVSAQGLTAETAAHTVNGDVTLATSGLARAETVNGNVNVTIGRADWNGALRFETVNGSISVSVPANLNAEVAAGTVNGDITTDFPLTVRGRFGPRRLEGVVGAGGRRLELETVNGAITLRRR